MLHEVCSFLKSSREELCGRRGSVSSLVVSRSGIGWFLCAAGRSQDHPHSDGRQLTVGAVDLTLLSFSLHDRTQKRQAWRDFKTIFLPALKSEITVNHRDWTSCFYLGILWQRICCLQNETCSSVTVMLLQLYCCQCDAQNPGSCIHWIFNSLINVILFANLKSLW